MKHLPEVLLFVTPRSNSKRTMATNSCCAECGEEEGGVSLKICKACMFVRYCNASCQHKHWPTHKKLCKLRAAELRDEALFKDPPPKEDCPICFLPMPIRLICCVSLPPATISSIPIYDFSIANENENVVNQDKHKYTEEFYPCCGKSICRGCVLSFILSGNNDKCPFCNSDRADKTYEERFEQMMKRVEANDPISICMLANHYYRGVGGLQQDHSKSMELFAKAADLGLTKAHSLLGYLYKLGGDWKKANFHYEAAAMAGNEMARQNLGMDESQSGNMERAVKHWTISASGGCYQSMHHLRESFEGGFVSRESIDSTLTAYNNSCAEMRSESRDEYICFVTEFADSLS